MGPTKIGGSGNGNVIVHPLMELRGAKRALHPIFHKESSYAVSLQTALRLSADKQFVRALRNEGIKELDQLGNGLLDGSLVVFESWHRPTLKIYPRFIVTKKNDFMAFLISDAGEMGPEGNRLKFADFLLMGRLFSGPVRTIEEHMVVLRREGAVGELLQIAAGGIIDCALAAVDQLVHFRTLEVQKALRELAKAADERLALRALHALAGRGEAHDLAAKVAEIGLQVAERVRVGAEGDWDDINLFVAFRALAQIGLPDHRLAYKIFCRLNDRPGSRLNDQQHQLIIRMRSDSLAEVRDLAALLYLEYSL